MPPKKAANAAKKPPSKTTKAGAPTKKSPATKPSDKPKEKPPATKPSDKSKEKAPVKPKDKDTAKATEEQAENTTTGTSYSHCHSVHMAQGEQLRSRPATRGWFSLDKETRGSYVTDLLSFPSDAVLALGMVLIVFVLVPSRSFLQTN